jgi:hypothetical protein
MINRDAVRALKILDLLEICNFVAATIEDRKNTTIWFGFYSMTFSATIIHRIINKYKALTDRTNCNVRKHLPQCQVFHNIPT